MSQASDDDTSSSQSTSASQTSVFDDVINDHGIDPKTKSKAEYGTPASRKQMLSDIPVPNHVLAANGIDVPHREYINSPDDAFTRTTTACLTDSNDETVRVHLHQDVKEDMDDDEFGNFGSIEDDTEDVVWTVVNLDNEEVQLVVVGEWGKRRTVSYETFADNYEPLYLADGQPRWGY